MVNKGFSVEKLLMDPYFEDVHVPKLIEINQNLSKNALPSLPISSTLSAQIKPEETGELETSTQPLAKDTPPEIDEGFDSWKRIVEPKLNEKLILPEVLSTNVLLPSSQYELNVMLGSWGKVNEGSVGVDE